MVMFPEIEDVVVGRKLFHALFSTKESADYHADMMDRQEGLSFVNCTKEELMEIAIRTLLVSRILPIIMSILELELRERTEK